jgi:transposase
MPRGISAKTPERLAQVLQFQSDGLGFQEIADRLELPYKTVYNWITDPDGAKKRSRVDRYRVACIVCGNPTDGSRGRRGSDEEAVCKSCAGAHYRIWTRDAIVLAIQEWAAEHGRTPSAPAWTRSKCILGDLLPATHYVVLVFGTWNAAIEAAGLELNPSGPVGGYVHLTNRQRRQCATRYAAGESSVEIAADFGCSPASVTKWVRHYGVRVRPSFSGRVAA